MSDSRAYEEGESECNGKGLDVFCGEQGLLVVLILVSPWALPSAVIAPAPTALCFTACEQ